MHRGITRTTSVAGTVVLVGAVAGGFLNVTTSLLEDPPLLANAFVAAGVLAASMVVVGLVQLVVLGLRRLQQRTVPGVAPSAPFWWLGLVLTAAALAPLAERTLVGDELTVAERVALGLAFALATLSGAAAGSALERRLGERGRLAVLGGLPWITGALFALLWAARLPEETAGTIGGTAAVLVFLVTAVLVMTGRIPLRASASAAGLFAVTTLVALSPLVTISPLAASARADADPSTEGDGACTVLLTIDALRADSLPFHDPDASPKPHLSRLMEESVVFRNARSPAPWTRPAFASVLTGLSPLTHDATRTTSILAPNVRTLGEAFREAGYRTGAVGFNPVLGERFGFAQGFDDYQMYPGPAGGRSAGAKALSTVAPAGRWDSFQASTVVLADLAIDWLRSHHDERFFFWIHFFDPHLPYAPPEDTVPPPHPDSRVEYEFNRLTEVRTGRFVPTAEERVRVRELYDAEVRHVDEHAGRVLEVMRELGLDERCLIAFTSDHGEELFDHGGFEHGHTLYDELLHVPLAIRLPGGEPHAAVDEPVSTSGLFATLLELSGVDDAPPRGVAPSLVPLWAAPERVSPPRPVIATGVLYYEERLAVVDGHRKYVRVSETGEERLYDLAADPDEHMPLDPPPEEDLRVMREKAEGRTRLGLALRREILGDQVLQRELDRDEAAHLRALGYVD